MIDRARKPLNVLSLDASLSLQAGLPHAVDAPEDSIFLLTVAPAQQVAPRP